MSYLYGLGFATIAREVNGMFSAKFKIGFLTLVLAVLSACGGSKNRTPVEEKNFSKLNLGTRQKTSYRVALERPDFSGTPVINDSEVKTDSQFASSIQHVRLDIIGDSMNVAQLTIKLADKGSIGFAKFTHSIQKIKDSYGFHGASEDNKYEVTALCTTQLCEETSIVLTERSSQKSVAIRYIHRNEFLKPESLRSIEVSAKDKTLLEDAAEYHFPIVRHTAQIAGREVGKDVVDLLIVERPQVDQSDEDFTNDFSDEPAQPEEAAPDYIDEEPIRDEREFIELESSPEGNLLALAPAENSPAPQSAQTVSPQTTETKTTSKKPTRPAQPATPISVAQKPTEPARTETPKAEPAKSNEPAPAPLVLTANPYDVYNIRFPAERLRGLTVRDPMKLVSFDIVPADQQERYEPAYRMAMIASAFVEQKVKIYQNACNYYVRAVMTLAGYTSGRSYQANDFGLIFSSRAQNLNHWAKSTFTHTGNDRTSAAATSRMDHLLGNIPESYATIYQIVRRGKHGHVAIVTRVDGKNYLFDASLKKHGPRKTQIGTSNLINRGRRNVNIYAIDGLIPAQQTL